ncbi:FYN-binding protein 1 [Tachyglossus aculeatus]|uniref:FYN-binding protein 1 n=1 Tax=Tachyglossus aculeatus TaxID=9261 RepID=UPI0018F33F2C|nr:FYN-binding protein 1 [Tachyglossus aculeatus]
MDGKTDVKSLMAKFNTGGNPTEDAPGSNRPFRVAGPTPPAAGLQARMNVFANPGNGSPPGPAIHPKLGSPKPPIAGKPGLEEKADKEPRPPFLKPTAGGQRFGVPAKPVSRDVEGRPGFPKPMGLRPSDLPKEEAKPIFPKPLGSKLAAHPAPQESDTKPSGMKAAFGPTAQDPEQKPVFPKLSGAKEKFIAASQDQDSRPPFPKPLVGQKPPASHVASPADQGPSRNILPQKGLPPPQGPKSKIASLIAAKEDGETRDHGAEAPNGPYPVMNLKLTVTRGTPGPGVLRNTEEKKDERMVEAAKMLFENRTGQEDSGPGSATPPRIPKPPSKLALGGPWAHTQEKEGANRNPSAPKRKALPAPFTLGPAPQKPDRPPTVDLGKFRKPISGNSPNKAPTTSYSLATPPPPPPAHPATQPQPPPPSFPTQPPAPSLPPRNIKVSTEPKTPISEENYDDVDIDSNGPGNPDEDQESDGETYEDIEASKERERKRDKEEKKRLEQEKKEQREKEKKEQEIRKKFKLTGPIQVLHQAKACCDVKGGKNELSCKQGDEIEVIRITDNPEGKWLGRTTKGSYGYVKTTAVEIDYDSLKRKKPTLCATPLRPIEDDQEVYDDVADQDSITSHGTGQSGSGGMFPPPPDDEIYDGIDEEDIGVSSTSQDEDKTNSWSWGLLKILKGKDDKKKSVREKSKDIDSISNEGSSFPPPPKQFGVDTGDDVYDDVDSSDFPAPPMEISPGIILGKSKSEEKDIKKLKRQEKEEKELKKKFKFEGEIRVLYSAKVSNSLAAKKWGAKDLPLKPGESLEVIQSTDDTKVLCRNEEGKYGYVLRSCLADNDGEIYDDIADGCIYDND